MSECKVPIMGARTRSDYLKDYREFDIEMGTRFNGSYSYEASTVLSENQISVPGVAYYCEELRIIDELTIFPGSPLFFAKLLEWSFETKRAYKDAYHEAEDEDLEAALYICVCEFDELVKLIMKYA